MTPEAATHRRANAAAAERQTLGRKKKKKKHGHTAISQILLTLKCDQVIRENPASRGTEASAEVLVGPPWRMESNAGQQQWY